ncbi:MAG: hypothetical protein AAFQ90_10440 [Pseudomonadota bacterium]
MRFPAVAVPPENYAPTPPPAMPVEIDARLAAITARATRANEAFVAKLQPTQRFVTAAASSDVETTRWAEAQVRLADLTSHHGEARVALADLDLLAADALFALGPAEEIATITEAQDRLSTTLDEYAEILAGMSAKLDR